MFGYFGLIEIIAADDGPERVSMMRSRRVQSGLVDAVQHICRSTASVSCHKAE